MIFVQGKTHITVKYAEHPDPDDIVISIVPERTKPEQTKACGLCGGSGRIDIDIPCWGCPKDRHGNPTGRVPLDHESKWASAEDVAWAVTANRIRRLAWLNGREGGN